MQVHLIFDMREKCASLLLGSADCLTHVHALLRTLMVTRDVGQNTDGKLQAYNEVSNEVGSWDNHFAMQNIFLCC